MGSGDHWGSLRDHSGSLVDSGRIIKVSEALDNGWNYGLGKRCGGRVCVRVCVCACVCLYG